MTNIEAIEVFGLKEEYEKLKATSIKEIEQSYSLSLDEINTLGFKNRQSHIEYLFAKHSMSIQEVLIKARKAAESSIKYLESSFSLDLDKDSID